jgi:hypothetical protein
LVLVVSRRRGTTEGTMSACPFLVVSLFRTSKDYPFVYEQKFVPFCFRLKLCYFTLQVSCVIGRFTLVLCCHRDGLEACSNDSEDAPERSTCWCECIKVTRFYDISTMCL